MDCYAHTLINNNMYKLVHVSITLNISSFEEYLRISVPNASPASRMHEHYLLFSSVTQSTRLFLQSFHQIDISLNRPVCFAM